MKKKEKLYIVPTEYGFMYGAGIFACLIGGAIYNNNLAFMLCFFLVALFLIGMVQTHNNLKKLSVEKIIIFLSSSESVGHGVLWIKSHNPEGHSQLRVQCKDNDDKIDVAIETIYKNSLHPQYFDFHTGARGKKNIKKIKISTRYPFGFFYVWRTVDCPTEYSVYPRPLGGQKIVNARAEGVNQGEYRQLQGDDFSEHKKYEMGESQKHIDWKAYARGRPLLTKKFEEGRREACLIDFDLAKGDDEERLRQLSKWIHNCNLEQKSYSLRVKNKKIPFGSGEKHKHNCLKLLAEYGESG